MSLEQHKFSKFIKISTPYNCVSFGKLNLSKDMLEGKWSSWCAVIKWIPDSKWIERYIALTFLTFYRVKAEYVRVAGSESSTRFARQRSTRFRLHSSGQKISLIGLSITMGRFDQRTDGSLSTDRRRKISVVCLGLKTSFGTCSICSSFELESVGTADLELQVRRKNDFQGKTILFSL